MTRKCETCGEPAPRVVHHHEQLPDDTFRRTLVKAGAMALTAFSRGQVGTATAARYR